MASSSNHDTPVLAVSTYIHGQAMLQGWLRKRGPTADFRWQARWCVLQQNELQCYTDETCAQRRANVVIRPGVTRIMTLAQDDAPGDAIKHRKHHPFGFVIDPGGITGGKARDLYYFAAEDGEQLEAWMKAIQTAAGITGGGPASTVAEGSWPRSAADARQGGSQAAEQIRRAEIESEEAKTTYQTKMLWSGTDVVKKGIEGMMDCVLYLTSSETQAQEKEQVLQQLAMVQKSLLDLCDKLNDLRQAIGGDDAVAEPIRPARKEDAPKHLRLGLNWSGIQRMLEMVDLEKEDAHTALEKVVDNSEKEKATLEKNCASSGRIDRTVTAIAMRKKRLANWEPTAIVTAYQKTHPARQDAVRHSDPSYALSCNGYDFLDVFVRPYLCRETPSVGQSMCEAMQDEAPEDAKDATWFLSHAQQETLSMTLSALCWQLHKTHFVNNGWAFLYDKAETYIWVDYSSLRQVQASDFSPEYVACIIQSIGMTVMMVESWKPVPVAKRLWCTFEIINSVTEEDGLVPITVKDQPSGSMPEVLDYWGKLSIKDAQTGADKRTEARIRASLASLGKDADFALQAALAVAYTKTYAVKSEEDLNALLHSAYAPEIQELNIEIADCAELPKELGRCSNLQKLVLYECSALKRLPVDIAKLQELRELTMYDCDALVELPQDLSSCKKLRTMRVECCSSLIVPAEEVERLKNNIADFDFRPEEEDEEMDF
eukprot:TRINITY_DN1421_c1_g1_i13.p1 TRINITY_DN1421_c1_g1~~TRINITY_DN1421_c1_g1_i13.p1  ORF type:complete len:752 (+),score=147.94 TRINITY_DN1421_c1_g1_i13:115-2256(+)